MVCLHTTLCSSKWQHVILLELIVHHACCPPLCNTMALLLCCVWCCYVYCAALYCAALWCGVVWCALLHHHESA